MDDTGLKRVDVHSHVVPLELPDFHRRFGNARWPTVQRTCDAHTRIIQDGKVYREIDESYFGHDARLRFLDNSGIHRQIISPLPVLLPYWPSPTEATSACRWLNQAISSYVARHPTRFVGFGTVALHDLPGSLALLDQIRDLGLVGLEIGTTYGGSEYSGRAFNDFFAAAAERRIPILIHPLEGAGMGRLDDAIIRFSVGVMTDTALATTNLLLAEVLVENPALRVCLSHGGGSFFWILPRLRGMLTAQYGQDHARLLEDAMRRVWVDSASLGVENLHYLSRHLGLSHILIGSDFPAAARTDPGERLREAGLWNHPAVCHLNAEEFLGTENGPNHN